MDRQAESGRSQHARFWDMTENCLVRARQEMDERENSRPEMAPGTPGVCTEPALGAPERLLAKNTQKEGQFLSRHLN